MFSFSSFKPRAFSFVIVFSVFYFMLSGLSVDACGGHVDDQTLNDVMVSVGVSREKGIKCSEITNDQFQQIGEAYMSYIHPDSEVHELMDKMMGGEGSESLKSGHILMGRQYLGCINNPSLLGFGAPMMNMSMMGYGFVDYGNNMMYQAGSWGAGSNIIFWVWRALIPLAILAFLVLGIVYLIKKLRK